MALGRDILYPGVSKVTTTGSHKRQARRNRVFYEILKFKERNVLKITAQDIALNCDLGNAWSAGHIIAEVSEKIPGVKKIRDGKYAFVEEVKA